MRSATAANTFKVIFCGKLHPGYEAATVIPRLATLLKLSPEVVQMICEGHERWVRDHLDFVTATRIQRAMNEAGAVCMLLPMLHCPACRCRQKQASHCLRCKKPLSRSARSPHAAGHLRHEDNAVEQRQKSRAVLWISIGLAIQASVVLIDQVLLEYGLDYRWLYGASVPAFVLAAYHLAPLKGYSRALALLCLFPLLGLAVLLLLPDRKPVAELNQRHQQWAGGLLMLVCLFVLGQWLLSASAFCSFEHHNAELAAALQSGPMDDAAAMDARMSEWMQQAFKLAASSAGRPDAAATIVGAVFRRLSDFFMNIHAQYATEHPVYGWGEAQAAPYHAKYQALFAAYLASSDDRYIKAEYCKWITGFGSEAQYAFAGFVVNLLTNIRFASYSYMDEYHRAPPDLASFSIPLQRSPYLAELAIDQQGVITMTFNDTFPEVAGQTLVVALFTTENRRGETVQNLIRIGGNLDDYHLGGYSIFHDWPRPDKE